MFSCLLLVWGREVVAAGPGPGKAAGPAGDAAHAAAAAALAVSVTTSSAETVRAEPPSMVAFGKDTEATVTPWLIDVTVPKREDVTFMEKTSWAPGVNCSGPSLRIEGRPGGTNLPSSEQVSCHKTHNAHTSCFNRHASVVPDKARSAPVVHTYPVPKSATTGDVVPASFMGTTVHTNVLPRDDGSTDPDPSSISMSATPWPTDPQTHRCHGAGHCATNHYQTTKLPQDQTTKLPSDQGTITTGWSHATADKKTTPIAMDHWRHEPRCHGSAGRDVGSRVCLTVMQHCAYTTTLPQDPMADGPFNLAMGALPWAGMNTGMHCRGVVRGLSLEGDTTPPRST